MIRRLRNTEKQKAIKESRQQEEKSDESGRTLLRLFRLKERRLRLRNSLVKYGFIKILELEFGIYLKEHETEKIELAETCIEVYDSVEDFL